MLTYFLPDYNNYKIRTKQLPSGSNYMRVDVQNMLTNDSYSFLANPGQWSYDQCESIVDISFNLDIALNVNVGDEYRIFLTPAITSSTTPFTYLDPVWHGSLQVFASQSVDKPAYINQIPLDDQRISRDSTNEFIYWDQTAPFVPTTTIAPTTTTIAPTTTTTLAPTTTTLAPTTTTTLSPTTTTTTIYLSNCDCYVLVGDTDPTTDSSYSYLTCGGSAVSGSLGTRETILFCAQTGSVAYLNSTLQSGSQIPANVDCGSPSTASCLPSASCQCITATWPFGAGAGDFWYHDCATNTIKAGRVDSTNPAYVCAVSGSWRGTSSAVQFTIGGVCIDSGSCFPTTTTTTIAPTTTTTAAPGSPDLVFFFGNQIGGQGFDVCWSGSNSSGTGIGIQFGELKTFMSSDSACTIPYGTSWDLNPPNRDFFFGAGTMNNGTWSTTSGGSLSGGPYYRSRISGSVRIDVSGFSAYETFDLTGSQYKDITHNGRTARVLGPNCTLNNSAGC